MKKPIFLPLLLLISFLSNAQTIIGSWEGILVAGPQQLKVVFHVKKDSTGKYYSSFDSPDQHAFGIDCDETNVKTDSLEIGIKSIHGGYRGKWDGKNNIHGIFFQSGQIFPLNLTWTAEKKVVLNRPQTPLPPFPYFSEDLEYNNKITGIHYAGTLTYPKSGSPFPAAILITGSGQQDRDETIFGHKPFAVIADFLTRKGFAVLRVDDRQTGKSTGDLTRATSMDFANDVETGLEYLLNRKEIDPKKIGLIGHSEGGLIASIIASKNKNIDFVIFLAGPGLRGLELLELQNEAYVLSMGASEKMAASAKEIVGLEMQAVTTTNDSVNQMELAWKSFLSWKKRTDPSTVALMGLSNDSVAEILIKNNLVSMNTPWFNYFIRTDPASFIKQLHCKALALNGSKDIQVLPDQNLAAIDSALKLSYAKVYSTQKITGLNHLFQHCKSCSVNEYGELEETFAPEALQIMGDWLIKNVK